MANGGLDRARVRAGVGVGVRVVGAGRPAVDEQRCALASAGADHLVHG